MKFLNNIDLDLNYIKNELLEKFASDPSSKRARIYYNTTNEVIRYYNNTKWISLSTEDDITTLTTLISSQMNQNPWKKSCIASTPVSVDITTLHAGTKIDGVTLSESDRVFLWNQADAKQNGIYIVSATPTRSLDADTGLEIRGMTLLVEQGTYAQCQFSLVTDYPITIGSDNLVYTQTGSGSTVTITAGNGIELNGGEVKVKLDGTSLSESSSGLKLSTATLNSIATPVLPDDSVTKEKVNADVAGYGLHQYIDGSLDVALGDGLVYSTITAFTNYVKPISGHFSTGQSFADHEAFTPAVGNGTYTVYKNGINIGSYTVSGGMYGSLTWSLSLTEYIYTTDTVTINSASRTLVHALTESSLSYGSFTNAEVSGLNIGSPIYYSTRSGKVLNQAGTLFYNGVDDYQIDAYTITEPDAEFDGHFGQGTTTTHNVIESVALTAGDGVTITNKEINVNVGDGLTITNNDINLLLGDGLRIRSSIGKVQTEIGNGLQYETILNCPVFAQITGVQNKRVDYYNNFTYLSSAPPSGSHDIYKDGTLVGSYTYTIGGYGGNRHTINLIERVNVNDVIQIESVNYTVTSTIPVNSFLVSYAGIVHNTFLSGMYNGGTLYRTNSDGDVLSALTTISTGWAWNPDNSYVHVDGFVALSDGYVGGSPISTIKKISSKLDGSSLSVSSSGLKLSSTLLDSIATPVVNADYATLSNIELDNFKSGVVKTAVSATPSDTSILTEKAVNTLISNINVTSTPVLDGTTLSYSSNGLKVSDAFALLATATPSLATTVNNGLMSSVDKSRLDVIYANQQSSTPTNLLLDGDSLKFTQVGMKVNEDFVNNMVGTLIIDSTSIDVTYTFSATPTLSMVVKPDSIDKSMLKANVAGYGLVQAVDKSLQIADFILNQTATPVIDGNIAQISNIGIASFETGVINTSVSATPTNNSVLTELAITNLLASKKYVHTITGDGNYEFTLTHNLGTEDIIIMMYDGVVPMYNVYPDIEVLNLNQIKIIFSTNSKPANGQTYKVVILS